MRYPRKSLGAVLTLVLATGAHAQQLQVTRGMDLFIKANNGEVRVTGWERDRIELAGQSRGIGLEVEGRRVRISRSPRARSADIVVQVPRWLPVWIEGNAGEIEVRDLDGGVQIENISGGVRLERIRGTIGVSTVSGGIAVRDGSGPMSLSSINGSLRLQRLSGTLSAKSTNGEIVIRGGTLEQLDAKTLNGDVDFDAEIGRRGRMAIETMNGDISLRLPPTIGALITVRTPRGQFRTDFQLTQSAGRIGNPFRFTLGDGQVRIDLETFQGTIALLQRGTRN